MRKLLIIALLCAGCGNKPQGLIYSRSYLDNPLLCEYYYYSGFEMDGDSFQDSCNKYSVGDTIFNHK